MINQQIKITTFTHMCQGQSMKHVGIFTQTLLGFSFNGYIELVIGVVILQHGDMTLNFDPGSHHPMRICMCIYIYAHT